MAIDPIYGNTIRNDLMTSRRQNQVAPADNAAAAPGAAARGAVAPGAAAPAAQTQRLPPRVLQMMQQGRETSALLSTLPGPNLSFFQPAMPPQGFGGGQAAQGRVNAPLMEMEQQGRTASALLSPLMGQTQRTFQPPAPPVFTGQNAAGAGAQAQPAGGQGMAAAPLPPAGARLLETEQAGRTTSTLLSGLMGSPQPAGAAGPTGDSLTTIRAAQEVIQAVGTTAPSAANMRIANEAYQMEAQAQQQYAQGVAGQGQGRWEWFA